MESTGSESIDSFWSGILIVLVGFFDESGHSSGTEFFALAAFVADAFQWAGFDDQWRNALNRHGAPYLHMREFAHSRGPFQGWTEDRRQGLLGECVTAINSIRAIAVGAAMSVEDFKKLDYEAQSSLQDPFFCCFQEVVRGAALNAHLEHKGLKVQMVFSRQDEFSAMASKLWNVMAEHIDVKERMGSLEFQDMRTVPGLQVADLLAYEFRHFYHLRQTRPGSRSRWAFREIVRHQREAYNARMLKYLPNWHLESQADGTFNEIMGAMLINPVKFSPQLSELFPDPE
jgi:hypothetical protein